MRSLRMPGERRVHFRSEGDSRRKFVLARMVDFGVRGRIYSTPDDGEDARDALLRVLVQDTVDSEGRRLVLESRDRVGNLRDRAVLAQTKARENGLLYEHREASTEPILWMSDALAWSAGAGGDWRCRIEPMVESVVKLPSQRAGRSPDAVHSRNSAKPRRRPSGRVPRPTSRGYCP